MNYVSIGYHLQTFNLQLLKVVMARYKELGYDITPVQGRIIMAIYESDSEFCQTDLKRYIACNKSTLSSILDTMEKKGLIVRKEAESDSRKKIIVLTNLSNSIASKILKDKYYMDKKLCEGLSQEEYIFFHHILEKMERNLERMKL